MSISLPTAGLHSKYDPWREAEKYLRHSAVPADSGIYILIEPGKGYLSHHLHTLNPRAKIIEIHCSNRIEAEEPLKSLASATWSPDSDLSLSGFLSTQIDDIEIGSVSVVEWPPAERVFGSIYYHIKNGVRNFLQERRATIHTTGKFGRLWLRNLIRRLAVLPPLLENPSVQAPIVVAASGPSLNRALPLLQSFRTRYFLIALPSSITALKHAGIEPDMIVHSDPGYYAMYHLHASHVAIETAPLYSTGYTRRVRQTVLLSTATPTEDFFFQELDIHPLQLAAHGTVAGLAFQLALKLTSFHRDEQPFTGFPLIFTGLDFCFRDIIAHATPHSFGPLLLSQNNRLRPLQQIFYTRSPRSEHNEQLQSYALERYAAWFQQLAPAYQSRVYRLFPSEVPISAFTDIDANGFEQVLMASQGSGSSEFRSEEPRQIPTAVRYAALQNYTRTLRRQFEECIRSLGYGPTIGVGATSACERLLPTLKNFPLLMEFLQYTNYSLLFRLRRGEADHDALHSAFQQSIREIDSMIQAVQDL